MTDDPLAPVRGILFGIVLGLALWVLVIAWVVWMVER